MELVNAKGGRPCRNVESIYRADPRTKLSRPLVSMRVPAGFPSPAEGYVEGRLDLNRLIKHPFATFFVRVTGDSMEGAGIFDGDLLVVDRAVAAVDGHIILARIGDEMCVKRLRVVDGKYWLYSENPKYPPIEITEEMDFETWGRVLHALRSF
jgi:DNA polymerase V